MSARHAALPSPPRSSQDACPTSSIPSSPSRPTKRRAKPTVTPRSFRRFFTPRELSTTKHSDDRVRGALGDITHGAVNNRSHRPPFESSLKTQIFDEGENPLHGSNVIHATPDSSPDRWLAKTLKRKRDAVYPVQSMGFHRPSMGPRVAASNPTFIERSLYRGNLGGLSMREIGFAAEARYRIGAHVSPPWLSQTAAFCSRSQDVHLCRDLTDSGSSFALPFCTTACHTNSLVAVGDEEGCIRLLDTAKGEGDAAVLRKPHLAFRPHQNAVLDMDFSADDYHMATASGDQTSFIIDMRTQQSIYSLCGHVSSVKQVRFQPGSGHNVIATSSRDGSVMLWDLRCKGSTERRPELFVQLGGQDPESHMTRSHPSHVRAACVGQMPHAHADHVFTSDHGMRTAKSFAGVPSQAARRMAQLSRTEISVTAISFVSPATSHLLLTGSEASATVKLWDLRAKQQAGGKRWLPLSSTRQPDAHSQHRHFGLTSMALNSDNSRLYTLCKDHSVYAYSMSHMMLGHAPELQPGSSVKRQQEPKEGMAPLYALRHPKLKASNFYIKSALRPMRANNTELLAVGSAESCAVLFPTDEKLLDLGARSQCSSIQALSTPSKLSARSRDMRATDFNIRRQTQGGRRSDLPVSERGTALVRGHEKEVTGLAWTADGELLTVSDDLKCRVWREDAERARDLRVRGEAEGGRWLQGWADIQASDPDWDADE